MISGTKTIGIIGGMGPLATVDLFNKIVCNTRANNDAEHIHILIDNNPKVPDRTEAILNGGQSPLPFLIKSVNNLINCGADLITIPCNTSHYYIEEIQRNCTVPIINMLDETMKHINALGINKVVLLATEGTVKTNIYGLYAQRYQIEMLVPDNEIQNEITKLIYKGVKAGIKKYDVSKIQKFINNIGKNENVAIVLGCTELPIAVKEYHLEGAFVDPTLILAKSAICAAGYSCNV